MHNIIEIELEQFLLIYLLLIIIIFIMKKCQINQTKLLIMASLKMTIQLIISGYLLTYIFKNPNIWFVVLYIMMMIAFTIYLVLKENKELNNKFKMIIAASISISGLFVIIYFVSIVVGESIFNPQYTIPIAGMLMGNTLTGVSLGIKSFKNAIKDQRIKINALICFGASPKKILFPFVRNALETAMLPTLNSMLGIGVISLPGMMTGQILAGTLPKTAILYQIAIMIAISAVVSCASFSALYFGYQTIYDHKTLIIK